MRANVTYYDEQRGATRQTWIACETAPDLGWDTAHRAHLVREGAREGEYCARMWTDTNDEIVMLREAKPDDLAVAERCIDEVSSMIMEHQQEMRPMQALLERLQGELSRLQNDRRALEKDNDANENERF